ncbi:hypothetical protein DUI87_24712 [Hirundo rustica rustica]|uniref:Uncharacterized protein n=1 Tax=Hirundo rustica rustica TaxID=333673 RepID=A0A3M0JCC6_HIRRU|nr:hypothetical protein DUI87_24712 [Hirundo rustica rustica]
MSAIIEFNFHRIDKRVELDREIEKCDLTWKERLFVSEENVDGFLGAAFCPSPCSQSALESQPLIEVLDVTEDRIQIRVEREPPATSSAIPGGSAREEPDLENAAAAGDAAPAPGSGKQGELPGLGDGDGDGEAAPGLGSGTRSPILREVNPQDGSVRILRDHRTRCPVAFQNSLLYELD